MVEDIRAVLVYASAAGMAETQAQIGVAGEDRLPVFRVRIATFVSARQEADRRAVDENRHAVFDVVSEERVDARLQRRIHGARQLEAQRRIELGSPAVLALGVQTRIVRPHAEHLGDMPNSSSVVALRRRLG